MTIEVWVVLMPNGDRPYTRAVPPSEELMKKWFDEGARIFKLAGEVPDVAPERDQKRPATVVEL